MNYYPFHIGDFSKDAAHLSLKEEGVYRRLIDMYYSTEKLLPLDMRAITRFIRARGEEELVEEILEEFFTKTSKGFRHTRIEKELKKYKEKSKKASKSAKARWNKPSKETEKPCERNANASETHNEGNANQEPITNNQEPNNKEGESNDSNPPAETPPKKTGFQKPNLQEVYECFLEKTESDLLAKTESQKFINHYQSNGWKVGKNSMKDWKAAVSGWVSRMKNYEKPERHEPSDIDFNSTGWSAELDISH